MITSYIRHGDYIPNLQFGLWFQQALWSATCNLSLHPHLSVEIVKFFTTAKLLLNNVLYKMQLI